MISMLRSIIAILNVLWNTKLYQSQIWYKKSNQLALKVKNPTTRILTFNNH